MNENRTYGIEVECYAKISMYDMAEALRLALQAAGSNHRVSVEGYGHDTSQSNYSVWKVKSDGSLISAPNEYPHPMEIVSPILKGQDGLDALKVICSVLEANATVNRTCGLHVHHGINQLSDSVRGICRNFYKTEKYFYMVLPNSRQANRYCAKWTERCTWDEAEVNRLGIEAWYSRHIGSRYSGLNLESLRMRNTVEFRMHSGSTEFSKIKNWTLFTQAFVDAGAAGLDMAPMDFEMFVAWFEAQREPEVVPVPEPVATRPVFIDPAAKKQRMPKQSTKAGWLAEILLAGTHSKRQIAVEFVERFGRLPNKDAEESIGSRIAEMKSLKYGFGANIREEAGKLKWLPLNRGTVTRLNRTVGNFGEDVRQACVWMRGRYAAFQGRRERTRQAA